MPRFYHSIPFIAVMMLCLSSATGFASEWFVTKSTKQVSFTVDKTTWVPVVGGMAIPNGSWISTGPRGRVELERGVEKVAFGPKTMAAIITDNGLFSRKTQVVQQKGEIVLNIEKRSRPHTYVHTPFLAAVVKGTTFTVTVTEQAASVSVSEGLVQVSSFTGGQSTNVGPGQQVTVDEAQSMSVAGIAEPPSVFSVEPVQASVPAVGQAAPVGAGLGLGSFGDQSSAGTSSGDASSDGVSGESSGGGDGFGQQGLAFGNGHNGNGNGNGGGNGKGNNGNGNGDGGGNGNGNNGNGNGNGGGNGKGNNGNGNGGGNGKGNNGNGNGNGGGNGNGNNGNGNGNGGGNGNGNNGNGNGNGNNSDD